MERREALRLLVSAAAIPLIPLDALALVRSIHQQLPTIPTLRTLNARQNEMVTIMAELIIPQTKTPGAKAARVNEFIDLMLTEWFEEVDKTKFLAGLTDVDERSQDSFAKDFLACTQNQQIEILTDLDEEVAELRNLPASPTGVESTAASDHFFHQFKRLTIHGYYTSSVGSIEELHEQMIPPVVSGCAPLQKEGAE